MGRGEGREHSRPEIKGTFEFGDSFDPVKLTGGPTSFFFKF
jgi:hypothetical protein